MLNAKRKVSILVVAAALLAGTVLSSGLQSYMGGTTIAAASEQEQNKRVISVTGVGELTVEPDVAYISMGVMTEGTTANEAQKANADIMAKVNKVLMETYKLAKKDVKTSGFYVQPKYHYGEKEPKLIGYTATHTLQVTYRNLDMIGKLLDDTSTAGINQMNNIQFGTEKQDEYEMQLIEKAMKNAKLKADAIAKAAGKSVKDVISVQYGSMGSYYPTPAYDYMGAKLEAASTAADTSISSGELKLNTSVSVNYEM